MKPRVLCLFPAGLLRQTYAWLPSVLQDMDVYYLGFRADSDPEQPAWEDFRSAHAVLQQYQPDLLLFRSVTAWYEAGLLQQARQKGIPTVWLAHGDLPLSAGAARVNRVAVPQNRKQKLPRLLRMIRWLFASAPVSRWSELLSYLRLLLRYAENPVGLAARAPENLQVCDLHLAFTQSGAASAHQYYQYPKERILVCGDPQAENTGDAGIQANQGYVVYIETDLKSLPGFTGDAQSAYAALYQSFRSVLANIPLPWRVRMHPGTPAEWSALYTDAVCDTGDLTDLWPGARLICGYRSTLLGIAIARDIPVVISEAGPADFEAVESPGERLYYPLQQLSQSTAIQELHPPSVLDPVAWQAFAASRGYGLPSRQRIRTALLELLRNNTRESDPA